MEVNPANISKQPHGSLNQDLAASAEKASSGTVHAPHPRVILLIIAHLLDETHLDERSAGRKISGLGA